MVNVNETYRRRLKLKRESLRRKAANGDFMSFIYYCNVRYKAHWHHKLIAKELEGFLKDPDRKRLMLFMPPQHGKSEIVSRAFPAFAFGMNPDLKIAACSYGDDLARSFNTDVKSYMRDTPYYQEIFPGVKIKRGKDNTKEFHIHGHYGSYKCTGVGGALSGRSVDLAIIDDPVKDYKEAISEVTRESIWQWYLSVLDTRLHNDSKVIVIMTRWHEDDLAGRLLARQPGEWEVISIPALKEKGGHPKDPRKEGEALWPQKHSLEKLLKSKKLSNRTFISMYQQRPSPQEGGILKRHYWQYYNPAKVDWSKATIHFFVDGAYTADEKNDPTSVLAVARIGHFLYIVDSKDVWKEFPDLIKWLPEHCFIRGASQLSKVVVEPKATGKSIVQMARKTIPLNFIEDEPPTDSKEVRVEAISPIVAAGRILLPENAPWLQAFIDQCAVFPNGTYDDRVDTLEMAIRNLIVNMPTQRGIRGGTT